MPQVDYYGHRELRDIADDGEENQIYLSVAM